MYLFPGYIIWCEIVHVLFVYNCRVLSIGAFGRQEERSGFIKLNKIGRISEVSLPLSLKLNFLPPYKEPKYINFLLVDKDSLELAAAFCRFLCLMGVIQ